MHRLENPRLRHHERESPSFSSSLLDKIYRSIDEGEKKGTDDLSFFRATMAKKQHRREEDESLSSFRRACLIEKWMEKKAEEKGLNQRRREQKRNHSNDTNDALFFSSTSSSSDSSSGGFSSSDTESMFSAGRSASSWPKPIRTCLAGKKQRKDVVVGDDDEALIKSKSRALKIYNNLKKVKQPISPGGKLASFINGLFKPHGKASKTPSFPEQSPATCSSASSFSRSCLSKGSPSTRERLRSASSVKRSVRFIVGEDSRPHEEEEEKAAAMPVSLTAAWKARRVGETAREFLRDYRQNQIKNELIIMRDQFRGKKDGELAHVQHVNDVVEDDDDDDDTASCSSSDLFELDHLAVRYQEELPVYETTRVDRNRAISNGLKV